MRLSRLRRISPQPFGLTADPQRPPLMLGEESSSTGMITETLAALTGSRVPLDRLSLLYANYFDLSAPFVEVTTHWDGRGWLTPPPPGYPEGAWELGQAERRDAALAGGNLRAMLSPERHLADGPFTRGTTEIVAGGEASQVATVSYRDYTALSFTTQGLTVTVVSRHPLPPSPRFDLVTDLEPFSKATPAKARNGCGDCTASQPPPDRAGGDPRPGPAEGSRQKPTGQRRKGTAS